MAFEKSSAETTTQRRILAAALGLFVERTWAGTAVPLVAERAGVGVGTIYRYLPGKEALGAAVYRRAAAQRRSALAAATARARRSIPGDVRAEFAAWWQALADFVAREPDAYTFVELHQHGEYVDADARAQQRDAELVGLDMIRRGQHSGAIRGGHPAVLYALVSGAFAGLVRAARAAGGGLDPATLTLTEQAAWDLLRSPSDGRRARGLDRRPRG
jgi:AcrR family transcriptional regulator